MKIIEFFKPNLRKIIFFIIVIFPFLGLTPPPQFYLINGYISIVSALAAFPYIIIGCILVGGKCMDMGIPSDAEVRFAFAVLFLLTIFFAYFISLILVYIRDKVFIRFGEKAKSYERNAVVVIFAIAAIFPTVSQFVVIVSRDTKLSVTSEEVDREGVLEELTVRNIFPLPVKYILPDVTACVYNKNGNRAFRYTAEYRTDKDWVRRQTEPPTPNAILLMPFKETKVYLTTYSSSNNWQGDQILLLHNIGMDNEDSCERKMGEKLIGTHKIKIINIGSEIFLNIQHGNEGGGKIQVTLEKGSGAKGKIILQGKTKYINLVTTDVKGYVYTLDDSDKEIYFHLDKRNSNDTSSFVIYTYGMNSDEPSGLKVKFFAGSEIHAANLKSFSSFGSSVVENDRVHGAINVRSKNMTFYLERTNT